MLVGLGALVVFGCAGRVDKAVLARASTDFSCPAEDVKLTQTHGSIITFEHKATGCEQSQRYHTECSIWKCEVQTFDEIDRENMRNQQYMNRTAGCKSNSECREGFYCNAGVCTKPAN